MNKRYDGARADMYINECLREALTCSRGTQAVSDADLQGIEVAILRALAPVCRARGAARRRRPRVVRGGRRPPAEESMMDSKAKWESMVPSDRRGC